MSATLTHRGPDQEGHFAAGRVAFGFRRLAILDLTEHGHQPMVSPDGRFVIVFNGEIYNYVELRQELRALGHQFQSSGDTEVLLHAYMQWGEDCLAKLNGMWAFLIFDRRKDEVFGSRDRFGIKPLYYVRSGDYCLFASEIKALIASELYTPEVNWRLASQYLVEGRLAVPDDTTETLYRDVHEIPAAGAFSLYPDGRLRQWSYWRIDLGIRSHAKNGIEQFGNFFRDSVSLRMRSDVPVGVCLSGGLDSTAIICEMARLLSANGSQVDNALQAFSYMAPEFDEFPQIQATIEQTGAELHQLSMDPEMLWSKLEEVLGFHDEPFHSMNVVVSYELYRMAARNGVKVILNGQGADETLAGYPSYFRDYWFSLLAMGRVAECLREIRAYAEVHGADQRALIAGLLKHFVQTGLARLSIYRRLANRKHRRLTESDTWFSRDLVNEHTGQRRAPGGHTLDAALLDSVAASPLPLYLRVEDRNSMAHSVEARLPFLDYRLVEFVFSLPPQLKMHGPWNKQVLREAMRRKIPEIVRNRALKLGFPISESRWFGGLLHGQLRELLGSRKIAERGIYEQEEILRDLEAHREGRKDAGDKLFRVVQFELFSQKVERATA